MLLSAICKMSANSRNRKRCGVSIDFENVRRLRLNFQFSDRTILKINLRSTKFLDEPKYPLQSSAVKDSRYKQT